MTSQLNATRMLMSEELRVLDQEARVKRDELEEQTIETQRKLSAAAARARERDEEMAKGHFNATRQLMAQELRLLDEEAAEKREREEEELKRRMSRMRRDTEEEVSRLREAAQAEAEEVARLRAESAELSLQMSPRSAAAMAPRPADEPLDASQLQLTFPEPSPAPCTSSTHASAGSVVLRHGDGGEAAAPAREDARRKSSKKGLTAQRL